MNGYIMIKLRCLVHRLLSRRIRVTYDLSSLYYTVDAELIVEPPIKTAKQMCVEHFGSVDNFLKSFGMQITDFNNRHQCYMCNSKDLVSDHGVITCKNCLTDNT